jgi:heme/copper-type cytochrome/quinol oxidase subunit 2
LSDLVLWVSSFYNQLTERSFPNPKRSLGGVRLWAPAASHPFLSQVPADLGHSSIATFLADLSERWVLGGALQRELHSVIPSDIRSVRRLRASKAVCLPSDTPIHIVCGSKDVIHSWAIPGLGVKIDCIPGFSSHRRLVLRWRGTF